ERLAGAGGRHADGQGDGAELFIAASYPSTRHSSADLLRQRRSALQRSLRQVGCELLAAQTRRNVPPLDAGAQRLRNRPDDLVAEHMSMRVVDGLEPIDVRDQQRSALQLAVVRMTFQTPLEPPPVQQTGERIEQGFLLRPFELLGELANLPYAALELLGELGGGRPHALGVRYQVGDDALQELHRRR